MRSTLLLLLTLGASAQGVDSPIHTAVQENDVEAIKRHLKGGADQNAIHPGSGQTPLMMAVLMGKEKVVEYLLSKEAQADVTIPEKDGYTPMHGAGFQGRAKIARMLIDNGIDPNSIHADGFTPIHRACWGRDVRHAETVRVFLEAGVPWDFAAKNGQTPLAMCKQRGHPMAVKALEEWREKSQKEL